MCEGDGVYTIKEASSLSACAFLPSHRPLPFIVGVRGYYYNNYYFFLQISVFRSFRIITISSLCFRLSVSPPSIICKLYLIVLLPLLLSMSEVYEHKMYYLFTPYTRVIT